VSLWTTIAAAIGQQLGVSCTYGTHQAVAGGDINRAFLLVCGERRFFVKLNTAENAGMFAAEAAGLLALAASSALRVPLPICHGTHLGHAYLAMEHLQLRNRGNQRDAGAALAELHRHSESRFGWSQDNTIGTTAQRNDWCDDWADFWSELRLGYQLDLAERAGHARELQPGRALQSRVGELLQGHEPTASLLHGDLWRGNFAFDENGRPAIFDPAVYFGDREADLAMTELFGGFDREFYAAYRARWPLPDGYPVRKSLYNLYHVLNHLNLFGGGYLREARTMIDRLLAELR
jgi:fructosamine-3-kinase